MQNILRRQSWFALFIAIGLTISLIYPSISLSQIPTTKTTQEIRGVWITNIDSDAIFRRDRLSSAIKQLRELNFNTIYPVAWNWGYTTYPSKVAKRVVGSSWMPKKSAGMLLRRSLTKSEGLAGRDIMQEMITQGHQQKFRVIPWFEFGFMAPDSSDPAGSDLAKLHPDWLTSKQDGKLTWKEGSDPRVWLNPFHPEVQKFMLDLVAEAVTKYDLDGIQFDDHFGLPHEFGYDKFTVDLYKKEHQGKLPPKETQNVEWINWRANKITLFMGEMFATVKAIKPKAIVSISPNPQGYAKSFFLQDWATWERKGFVDELVIQIYRDKIETFITEMGKPEVKLARQRIPVAIGVLSGLKPKPIPISQIQTQVAAVRQQALSGVSFFFYETLWKLSNESVAKRKQGFKQMFS